MPHDRPAFSVCTRNTNLHFVSKNRVRTYVMFNRTCCPPTHSFNAHQAWIALLGIDRSLEEMVASAFRRGLCRSPPTCTFDLCSYRLVVGAMVTPAPRDCGAVTPGSCQSSGQFISFILSLRKDLPCLGFVRTSTHMSSVPRCSMCTSH